MGIEIILRLAAIGLITAIATILLKKAGKDEIATLVTIAGLILGILIVLDMVLQLFTTLSSLFDL